VRTDTTLEFTVTGAKDLAEAEERTIATLLGYFGADAPRVDWTSEASASVYRAQSGEPVFFDIAVKAQLREERR